MEADEDALGTAMLDFQRGGLRGTATHRDGAAVWPASVAENYFGDHGAWLADNETEAALYGRLDGPLLDVGCGAGGHAVHYQERFETVAFDVSPNAVRAARERGVEDARVVDMFEVTDAFERGRFAAALCIGTHLGLGGSLAGVSAFLADLAQVTTADAVALVDSYDPTRIDDELAREFGGYRSDPREGVCRRAFHVEYHRETGTEATSAGSQNAKRSGDGEPERLVGPDLSFVLFSPGRLRDACVGTPWRVAEVVRREVYYEALLEKA
ncbi:class I SAM-dependent methyltransferase [Halomarina rubra]|uniref:Class I SAM-dependent methyltransferase n=1 Tax=Halomarina rubra TaxID=2071873 RepID=A0ABD6APS8_9EURY|nr:class I SAM-dependent methyltransferase [Halomarina rubra]